ncbi:MAG: TonB-dependent receptor [Acidobacteria bacterium]|nr:TonB-dependent receptor [Acidobacteriota bacterium]
MSLFPLSTENFLRSSLVLLTAIVATSICAPEIRAAIVVQKVGNLGIIKGVVRNESGSPIADATVAIFRPKTSKILKQVRSASDGSFLAKVLPGTYTVLAVAQGFNPATLSEIEVSQSTELVYRFNLERSGSGNTLPEKVIDRNSSKSRIRAAQIQRSIYQNQEGASPVDENKTADKYVENIETGLEGGESAENEEDSSPGRGQGVVETYFANTGESNYKGVNFATLQPISENAEIIFAGQFGISKSAPQRFETSLNFRAGDQHKIHLSGAFAKIGQVKFENTNKSLGQVSFQALDEWKTRSGVIVVIGIDYSKFVGAGNDFSISPRFGLQFDIDSKTRFRTAYTSAAEERSWQNVIELEETQVLFREPAVVQDFIIEDNKPKMIKNRRLEFGIERVLSNKSNIEANAFFDTVSGRGVGLTNFSFDNLDKNNPGQFVSPQKGTAQGLRIVYTRRLNGIFSTSAGYAFGSGQKLSEKALTNPENVFENDFFQTFVGQFDADFETGTQVKTIFRLSPQATVFAIDPFAGRMAIYDPSLSVLVTQSLPTLGLPFRAKAVLDARNLFDFQTGIDGEEGSFKLNSGGRILRGGISLRF